jgi:toxin ParE1/3/4
VSLARLRPRAEADLIGGTRYYLLEAGDDVAVRFFDAAVAALRASERMPGTVSPGIDIPGLRVRRIAGFPCGWFYFSRNDHIDVVRLLADAQDLAAIRLDLDDE